MNKTTKKYDLMTLSSMGVRLTPQEQQPVHTSTTFSLESTSAETNVLNISASLGLNTKVLTRFVANSPIAKFIQADLRKRNIYFEGPEIAQANPWGYRHQFNIADNGFGLRGPRVHNDRAGEVGLSIQTSDFDLPRLFEQEGCKIFHLSGLIAAMSPETSQCCMDIATYAKKHNCLLAFDLNYRASFWENREAELRETFHKITALADILIGNEEDYQLALGIQGPEPGGSQISKKIESFKGMIYEVKKAFPNVSTFATTLREVQHTNLHNWGAILYHENNWYIEEPREIPVLDRIGGGDSFVGGLLYGLLRNWDPQKCLQFGWATGAMTTTLLTDYATPLDEDQVWSIYKGNARVKR